MNMDTRNLLVKGGEIALRPSALTRGDAICDFCTLRDQGCDDRAVERCGQFVPALSFIDETGLDGTFSTFRGSAVWYDRARVIFRGHKRFGLVRMDGSLIGYARLVDAHRDGFARLMQLHAHTNHLMKDRGFSKQQAADELTRWIKNHMGSMYVREPEALNTVLYLERLHEETRQAEEAGPDRLQAPDRALHGVDR